MDNATPDKWDGDLEGFCLANRHAFANPMAQFMIQEGHMPDIYHWPDDHPHGVITAARACCDHLVRQDMATSDVIATAQCLNQMPIDYLLRVVLPYLMRISFKMLSMGGHTGLTGDAPNDDARDLLRVYHNHHADAGMDQPAKDSDTSYKKYMPSWWIRAYISDFDHRVQTFVQGVCAFDRIIWDNDTTDGKRNAGNRGDPMYTSRRDMASIPSNNTAIVAAVDRGASRYYLLSTSTSTSSSILTVGAGMIIVSIKIQGSVYNFGIAASSMTIPWALCNRSTDSWDVLYSTSRYFTFLRPFSGMWNTRSWVRPFLWTMLLARLLSSASVAFSLTCPLCGETNLSCADQINKHLPLGSNYARICTIAILQKHLPLHVFNERIGEILNGYVVIDIFSP